MHLRTLKLSIHYKPFHCLSKMVFRDLVRSNIHSQYSTTVEILKNYKKQINKNYKYNY